MLELWQGRSHGPFRTARAGPVPLPKLLPGRQMAARMWDSRGSAGVSPAWPPSALLLWRNHHRALSLGFLGGGGGDGPGPVSKLRS